jgi:hypothetical protein
MDKQGSCPIWTKLRSRASSLPRVCLFCLKSSFLPPPTYALRALPHHRNDLCIRQCPGCRPVSFLDRWKHTLGCASCWLGDCGSVYCCGACLSLLQLIKRHHFIFLASLLDCDNLCYIRSSTLSVRRDLLHPMPCEFIHTVAIIPSVQNSDRCTPHTPYPRPSCGYLICLLRGLQNPDPVYATRICHNFLFLLPVLPKLYLLLSWRNR